MTGAKTHHGEILSERSQETLELHEISHLLAATANDAYNALVCTHYAPEMGQNQVFQFPSLNKEDKDVKAMARTVRGRIAFDGETGYEEFMRKHYAGWQFRSTRLTDEYTYEDFVNDLPRQSILIAEVSAKGEIHLFPFEDNSHPHSGNFVISYQPPTDDGPSHPDDASKSEG